MPDASDDTRAGDCALLCVGTAAADATRLAQVAASLLAGRRAVVLSMWQPPPMEGPLDTVLDALYDIHADVRAAERRRAEGAAAAAAGALQAAGWDVEQRVVVDERRPWQVALEVADAVDARVVVTGASEAAEPRAGSLGGEARALAHRTHRPLLVLPAGPPAPADAPALFAVDGSDPARAALAAAARLLRPRPAIVAMAWSSVEPIAPAALLGMPDALAVEGAHVLDDETRAAARRIVLAGAGELGAAGWPVTHEALEAPADAADAIVDAAAAHGAGVIVTGTRGRSRIAAALLGSSAEAILRHAGRAVLLVPPSR